jgi:DNA-binding FrmR family transcriptional regulator
MRMDPEIAPQVLARLRRARGQIDGVIGMIEAGRDCTEIITQLAAASKAMDRAGFAVVSAGLRQCAAAEQRGEPPLMDPAQLEKLFLALA